jgi:hypothetical protein
MPSFVSRAVLRGLLALVGLSVATPAHAGFYARDRYDPPMPHFLTPTFDTGVLVGGWGSTELADDTLSGLAWNVTVGGRVLVAPMVKVGLRAGAGPYGGQRSDGAGSALQGFRQSTGFVDATAELATPVLRVYGFTSLAGGGPVRGPAKAFDGGNTDAIDGRPDVGRVAASYRHVGVGIVPRWLPTGKTGESIGTRGVGFVLEARRTWMATAEPSSVAPNEAAGWMVLSSVTVDFLARRP